MYESLLGIRTESGVIDIPPLPLKRPVQMMLLEADGVLASMSHTSLHLMASNRTLDNEFLASWAPTQYANAPPAASSKH